MALDLNGLTTKEAVTAIYVGYFNRAPAPTGLNYWVQDITDNGYSLADVARAFAVQSESQAIYPDLGTEGENNLSANVAFVTAIFQNLFGRDPSNLDTNGGADNFWVNELQNGADVGQLILNIMSGAQGDDLAVLENKIEVGLAYSDASEAAGELGQTAGTHTILDGIDASDASVADAMAAIGVAFPEPVEPSVPGSEFFLTSGTDAGADFVGTDNDDSYYAYIAQNPFAGGISNTLSSADRLDGGAGYDHLYAEITTEFRGVTGNSGNAISIQPRVTNIEQIDFEARSAAVSWDDVLQGGEEGYYGPQASPVVVDAKHINGHDKLSSVQSDGDLVINNVTTLDSNGVARNTSDITIGMDHTDNFNSDGDASDLIVKFDNDYLLSGQEAEGKLYYFLLDEDADLAKNPNRLDKIDVDGLRFNITNADGTVTSVTLESDDANTAGTHQGFVNALQPALQALIANGTLPAGTTLTLDPTITDTTFIDDGSESFPIPAMVLTSGDGSKVVATGFSRIAEPIGEYDVYGRFSSTNEVEDQPISINIDLHKVGRGGEGGDLIIGAKTTDVPDGIANGIEVFNIAVHGAGNDDPNGGMTKPSNLGTINSTGEALRVVNIVTAPEFATGATFASLTVREGFGDHGLDLINADGFLGDLTLGNEYYALENVKTITAQGGGDVSLYLDYYNDQTGQAYSVTTGAGSDLIDIYVSGDGLDYAGNSLNVSTGDGDDIVKINMGLNLDDTGINEDNEQLNQAILDNVTIETGTGEDFIELTGRGNANINAGAGDDVIITAGNGVEVYDDYSRSVDNAKWAFNFDTARASVQGGVAGIANDSELPGTQTSLAYLSGAKITVTLSGAGIGSIGDGGGVMALRVPGAISGVDGYESTVTIGSLINGNKHFGDQRDVNAAIMQAINDDPVLGNLLNAYLGSNNTLVIESLTSGKFSAEDLRIDIGQKALTGTAWNAVQSEARTLFNDSTLAVTDINTANTAAGVGDLSTTSADADAWFDGLSAKGGGNSTVAAGAGSAADQSNLVTSGGASNMETDNVINGGAGDDLIVLSTDGTGVSAPLFTPGGHHSLLNGASNETIVFSGDNFGDDTIMNFTTSGNGYTIGATGQTGGGAVTGAEAGLDFLDFTSYLTSKTTSSGSAASTTTIVVGVETNTGDIDANEAVFAGAFTAVGNQTWDNLSASDIAGLFNSSNDYGSLIAGNFTAASSTAANAVVGGAAKAVIAIENANNLGEYKVFELSWNSSTNTGHQSVSVNDLGSADFGTSLDGMTALNIVGTADYNNLIEYGFA